MNNLEYYLTGVAKDWSEHNLSTVQAALLEAERATLLRSDPREDPLLDTPNLPNFRGVLRWIMVQRHLHTAFIQGRFQGITARWVDLAGAHVLELRGEHTVVTPCHLLSPDDVPRETKYRKSLRVVNQVCPLLKGFECLDGGVAENDPIQILLVHGGRKENFAYLRAYIDPDDPAIYRQLSKNILSMPILLPSMEVELVAEPVVALKAIGKMKELGEAGS